MGYHNEASNPDNSEASSTPNNGHRQSGTRDYHGDAAAAGAKAGSRDHDDPGATADHGGSPNPGPQDGSSGDHSDGSANNHGPRDTGDHGSDYGDTDTNAASG